MAATRLKLRTWSLARCGSVELAYEESRLLVRGSSGRSVNGQQQVCSLCKYMMPGDGLAFDIHSRRAYKPSAGINGTNCMDR